MCRASADQRDSQALLARRGIQERQAKQGRMGFQVLKVNLAIPEQMASPDNAESKGYQANRVSRAIRATLESKDPKVTSAQLDLPEPMAPTALTESKAPRVSQVSRDQKVPLLCLLTSATRRPWVSTNCCS